METKKIAFAFGRMNPPTIGHGILIKRLLEIAKKHEATPIIFLSRTEDKKKNPLPFSVKLKMARKFFPEVEFVDDESVKTPINAFTWIANKGFSEVYFLAGSDRIQNYKDLAERNKTRFNVVELISAGERDPDADDASGMSASKMRGFAKAGDFSSFRKGMPSRASEKDAEQMYKLLQDVLNEGLRDLEDEELLQEFFLRINNLSKLLGES
jgi:predicted amidohydrolase YtcJ